ncbi:MAG: GTP cyclohydrolase I FolE [Bacteroidales bacterium]|nr:GTP cyclohydrolase I FolE [Bacteroidales bacterium]
MDSKYPQDIIDQIASHMESIIKLLGEDPKREGLLKTPQRAAKALYYATEGYRHTPQEIINEAIFSSPGEQMIVVKDIEFYSFCEHHILPFFGRVSVGYIPTDKTIGLSKLARIVDLYARRLQVQERLTTEVCREVSQRLNAAGVIVTCTAQHLCMKMRGVEKQDSSTTTVATEGLFKEQPELRKEFFDAIK